jgi:hypothetical protein
MAIQGTSKLSVPNQTSTFNWGGGTITAPFDFGQSATTTGGTMTINGSDVTLGGTLNNYGTVNWSSQNGQSQPGPNIINLTSAGTFNNFGTFNINTAST